MTAFTEDSEPIALAECGDNVVPLHSARKRTPQDFVAFDRKELDQILRVYGFKVAAGEWRDYAIDMLRDRAVFSVFRRSTEFPLFTIEKSPRLSRRQGAYTILNPSGQILKRGHELANVLRFFERGPRLVRI